MSKLFAVLLVIFLMGSGRMAPVVLTWEYDGYRWIFNAGISVDEYMWRRAIPQNNRNYLIYLADVRHLRLLAGQFRDAARGIGHNEIDFIVNVVKENIDYMGNEYTRQHAELELYKYPLETLLERTGDSDDLALLTAAFLRALGYPVAIVRIPDFCEGCVHVALAVYEEMTSGWHYEIGGYRFFYVDPTFGTRDMPLIIQVATKHEVWTEDGRKRELSPKKGLSNVQKR